MAKLKVNGAAVELEVDEATPLLWVLREQLGLTGAKYSCGIGLCGACTVLVNGEGQVIRDDKASGSIDLFEDKETHTYLMGDAAPAYRGKLITFKRHILFLRPGIFLLLDELEAPAEASFQWMLHAFEKMKTGRTGPAPPGPDAGRYRLMPVEPVIAALFPQSETGRPRSDSACTRG